MSRLALSPNVEDSINAHIKSLNEIPKFADALDALDAKVMADNPHDVPVVLSNVSMDDDAFIMHANQMYKYTTHSLYQLTNRIKPHKTIGVGGYFAACPPELRAVNFNYWHTEKFASMPHAAAKNNAVLRMRNDGELPLIRGVVSKTYVIVDDIPLLRTLQNITPNGSVMRVARGDLKSRYDIIWPSTKTTHSDGDVVNVAIRLTNSEAGMSGIYINPSIYITRGYHMIVPGTDIGVRHVGECKSRLGAAFARAMKRIGPFIASLNAARGDEVAKVTNDMDVLFVAIGKMFDLPATQVEAAKMAFHSMNNPTRAGIAMALCEAANSYNIVDAEAMQYAAGKLIADGWAHIERLFNVEEDTELE